MHKSLIILTYVAAVQAVSDIIVTNDELCTKMAKDYIEEYNFISPLELAIIVSTCEGIVNPQYSGLGGGFMASIVNGYCKNSSITGIFMIARERSPSSFQIDSDNKYNNIGIPSMLKGYERLYKLKLCNKQPKMEWSDLFTKNIELARDGWNKTAHFQKYWHHLGDADHPFQITGNIVKNPSLANTLLEISNEGSSSSLYKQDGKLHKIVLNDLRSVNSSITSNDLMNYTAISRNINKPNCFNYTLMGTSNPGSSFTFALGCKIVEASYGTIMDLSFEEKFLFMYHTLRYMYSIKPHIMALDNYTILHIFNNKENIANAIFLNFEKPWNRSPKTTFGNYTLPNQSPHKDGSGTANIIIKRGKFAITMTSTINSYWGSKLMSPLGFFYNDQLKDFDAVGTPNEPKRNTTPQSATSGIVFYSKKKNPVFQIGAAGGGKMIGAIFNTFFNYFVNNMTLEDANYAPRCMPLYRNEKETIYCERDVRQSVKDIFKSRGMKVTYTDDKFGGVTVSSTLRKGPPEAAHDHRRGGSSWINTDSNYEKIQTNPNRSAAHTDNYNSSHSSEHVSTPNASLT